nr:uncharacterized protein LOC118683882 isoform X1 [Bactrocera oleae]
MTYIGNQICLQSVEATCIQSIWLNEFSLPLHVHTTLSGRNWRTLLHITPENTTTLSHHTTTRHTAKQQNGWFHIRGSTFVCTQCRVNTTFNTARFLHSLAQFDS